MSSELTDRGSVGDENICTWTKTRQAVAKFRDLLLCAKCSKLMSEPVCIGACQHMFCRTCAGTHIGSGCCVCHSPAWVKDVQVNRQLSNITQLFCDLDSLLNPKELSAMPPADSPPRPTDCTLLKTKKNVKIWFSPRSRKVRCRIQKADEREALGPRGPKKTPQEPPRQDETDLSVFNFNSSSQDSASSPQESSSSGGGKKRAPRRKKKGPQNGGSPATRWQTKMADKQNKLAAINKEWGIGQEGAVRGEGGLEGDDVVRSKDQPGRKVSFQIVGSVPDALDRPLHCPQQEDDQVQVTNRDASEASPAGKGGPGTEVTDLNVSPAWPRTPSVKSAPAAESSPKPAGLPSPCRSYKRALPPEGAQPESTPKRRRDSLGRGGRSGAVGPVWPATPSVRSGPDVGSPARRSPKDRGNPSGSPRTSGRGSPGGCTPLRGRLSQGSPAHLKRNHNGETPLHLAAIKGDVEAVKELLDQGADPNLKDHAGWTPLHEACNLGHLNVVAALILQGALLNTPGYQNDSPLHDAVRNGHTPVARLLLRHGASRDVLNAFGLLPADCAQTPEMQAILRSPSEGCQPLSPLLSPTASLNKVHRDRTVVFLGSKLTGPQRNQLTKLSLILGARCTDSFSSSVTHIVVPDGLMPTTLSCLRGVLNGCWVLHSSWVEACLKAGVRVEESGFEAGEGPQRSRLNRDNLLPQLFNGCFFFLLGSFQNPPREELLRLAREGGGQVLARQPKPESDVTQTLTAAAYHAAPGSDQSLCTQYILYDPRGPYRPPRVRLGKVWSAPASWLLDCVANFRLLPVPEL